MRRLTFFMLLIAGITSCVKPFAPNVTTTNSNYLVVEGLINVSDSTFIHLSRTVTVSSPLATKAELKATITIESNTGSSYPVKEVGSGLYTAPNYLLNPANQYRLRIKTSNGNTYTSDFEATMVSPPVDSVGWVTTNSALNINVTTHDPKNATRYYRWDYSEEWKFHTDYDSFFVSDGLKILQRTPAQQVYECFGGDTSHLINVGTSAGLAQDVINQQVFNTILSSSEKISLRYSVMVKQYALTKNAYDYWTLLKKNTEQLGSIFDAQPSASIGNVHNINIPAEVVIGYISAGTITGKRIFIDKSQLPKWVTTPAYPVTATSCTLDTIPYSRPGPEYPQNEFINYKSPLFLNAELREIPVLPLSGTENNQYPTYLSSHALCVDCTLRGTTKQPAYWK